MANLEHVNVTVSDPKATAAWLGAVFGWTTRWEGDAMSGGYTAHVGDKGSYVALYTPNMAMKDPQHSYTTRAGLNHVGVVVDDIDATEARVKAAGFTPHNHADYEPGKRFYFDDHDDVEWEVVSYN
ncbi:VOC family protein [Aliiroseovarius crassostreae]|uniref:VOC family protein n=1 Tax=Aliiroseovarius crassostreae TaxID=154981 RepID=UPI00220E2418|nr:VOC family protein [Aliiroseovarius crassostreae]UWQ04601.1 VOC family protein [Aliiroseovarius crassostreae]